MRNHQRKVSDYLHDRPDTVAADEPRHASLQRGEAKDRSLSSQEQVRDGVDPARPQTGPVVTAGAGGDQGDVSGEDRRALGELEELARRLQDLHATMDNALDTVATAQQNYSSEIELTDTPLEPEPAAEPAVSPNPVAKRRTGIIAASLAAGVSVAALLGLVGWMWHANSEFATANTRSAAAVRPAQQTGAGQAPLAAPREAGAPKDESQIPPGISAAPVRADDKTASPAGKDAPQQVSFTRGPLHGVAGEPIRLGIQVPETASGRNLSVVVKGVSAPATLTNGMHMGGDIWMVDAAEADAVALLTPATFTGKQVSMDVRLVSNDGRISEPRTLTVAVEPSQAFAAAESDTAPDTTLAMQQEPPLANGEPGPTAPMYKEVPSPAAEGPQTAAPPAASDMPVTQPRDPAQQVQAEQPLTRAEEVAAAQSGFEGPGSAQPSLLAQPAPGAQPAADAPADAAQAPPAENGGAGEAEPSRTEPVTTYVNMRAEPLNDAVVVTVVPAGKRVGVISCGQWCEVTFAGKRGWIHNRFVGQERRSDRPAPVVASSSQRMSDAMATAQARASANSTEARAEPAQTASVTASVNMRAKPSSKADVVTVVPAGGEVSIVKCGQWCEVVFAGKRGWIHNSLVGEGRGKERSASRSKGGFWKKLSPF